MYYVWRADIRTWRGHPAYVEMRPFRKDWYRVADMFSCEPFREFMPERLEFDMHGAGGGLPDHITSANFEPVSTRLARLILDTGVSHEQIPVSIYDGRTGSLMADDYSYFHIMNCLEAVDMERTVGEVDINRHGQPFMSRVRHLVLKHEVAVQDPPMFRVREVRSLILVNDDFRSACLREGLTGSSFVPLDDFDEGTGWDARPRS